MEITKLERTSKECVVLCRKKWANCDKGGVCKVIATLLHTNETSIPIHTV